MSGDGDPRGAQLLAAIPQDARSVLLPAEIAAAIEGLKMNPAHDHLNALLEKK